VKTVTLLRSWAGDLGLSKIFNQLQNFDSNIGEIWQKAISIMTTFPCVESSFLRIYCFLTMRGDFWNWDFRKSWGAGLSFVFISADKVAH